MTKILMVEDDVQISAQVAEVLGRENFLVDVANCAAEARGYFVAASYDLIILDWELPDATGPDICHEMRKSLNNVPVIFLTGRVDISDKERGFASGGDDYLTKPFHMTELLFRVKALLKRTRIVESRTLQVRDITIDLDQHEVIRGGRKIELFPKEYALLEFFMRHPNQIFSADNLLRRIWPTESDSSPETVRVTLMRIRQKLNNPDEKPLIQTLRNIGYRLEP